MKASEDVLYLTIKRRFKKKQTNLNTVLETISEDSRDYTRKKAGHKVRDPAHITTPRRMTHTSVTKWARVFQLEVHCINYSFYSVIDIGSHKFKKSRHQSLPAIDANLRYLRCFRLADLDIGDVIGKGFYGSVTMVTHRDTGQVMVMKEMLNCTEQAKKTFMKEVSYQIKF